ncbi:MAG: HD domain-containing protein [Nitrospirota bacterium]|nr:HD domain-containing protein [Nitrospirota bacterium]
MDEMKLKLSHKLTLCFFSFAVLIWVTGLFAVSVGMRDTKNTYLENTGILASSTLLAIDRYINGKIEIFQEYSSDLILTRAVERSNLKNEGRGRYIALSEGGEAALVREIMDNELSRELRAKTLFYENERGYKLFPQVFITNRYGAVIAMTERMNGLDQSGKEWWSAVKDKGFYASDVRDIKDGNIDFGVKIEDEKDSFIGAIKFTLNIEEVRNTIMNMGSVTEDNPMNVMLIARDMRLISSNLKDRSNVRYIKGVVDKVCSSHNGTEDPYYQYENGSEFFVHAHSRGYRDYKGLGWSLIIESKPDHIFSNIYEFRRHVLYISIAVTVLAILMGIISFNIISRPLKKLMEASGRIGRGELDVDIDIRSGDEIGQLAAAFRDMTANLRKITVRRDELAREIGERKKVEESLRQSKAEWEKTFDTIPDMITIHDNEYNIIRANSAAKKVLSLPEVGPDDQLKCYHYYHGNGHRPEECRSCNTYNTHQPCVFEMFEPHLDRFLEVRSVPQFNGDGGLEGVIHIVRDISGHKKAENRIQDQVRRLNSMHSVEKAINTTFDLNVILDVVLDQVLMLLKVDAAAVMLFNKFSNMLEYTVSKGFTSAALKYTKLGLGESNAGTAAIERRIVSITDLRKNPGNFERSKDLDKEGFISYFAVPLIAKGRIKGVLEVFHCSPLGPDHDWMQLLETIANQAAIAIDNATLFEGVQRSHLELKIAYDSTIEGWAKALDMRDKETEGHSRRVTDMTVRTAAAMGIKEEEMVQIRRGALLHDIGKMGIPDSILLKPDRLNEEEWKIMKMHPVYAHEMLKQIKYLLPAIDIPYCHHERWDGKGYPRGLKGEEIPVVARIFAIVDVWDALRSDRPYRPAWTQERVEEHIRSQSGSHFDPEILKLFLSIDWSGVITPVGRHS